MFHPHVFLSPKRGQKHEKTGVEKKEEEKKTNRVKKVNKVYHFENKLQTNNNHRFQNKIVSQSKKI